MVEAPPRTMSHARADQDIANSGPAAASSRDRLRGAACRCAMSRAPAARVLRQQQSRGRLLHAQHRRCVCSSATRRRTTGGPPGSPHLGRSAQSRMEQGVTRPERQPGAHRATALGTPRA
ncbi:hypothetical protein C6Q22_10655 [Burkholderia multivorans]|nr:hypothetical protein WK22_26180 [Burkholderia multivorans]PRF88606.1 hypothetical protein C6Q22_10655 [Burkholderia multivorans]PRG61696.1 hypothetical protein C6T69_26715 [Burkholderia multivorans]